MDCHCFETEISIFNQLSKTICRLGMNVIHINTSERNRGMDIHQLKQLIDASGKKLIMLGNEYIKSKDEIAARKVLVKMFGEISQQTLLLGEQNAQMDRNQRGLR